MLNKFNKKYFLAEIYDLGSVIKCPHTYRGKSRREFTTKLKYFRSTAKIHFQ